MKRLIKTPARVFEGEDTTMDDKEPGYSESAPAAGEVNEPANYDLLLLPAGDFVLECWKVKEGTLVRNGETVALACLSSAKSAANNNNSSKSSSPPTAPADAAHKRPSRRKRPSGAVPLIPAIGAITGTFSDGEMLKSIKLPPTAADQMGKNKKEDSATADDKGTAKTASNGTTDTKKLPQSIPIIAPMTGFVRVSSAANAETSDNKRAIGYIEPCPHPAVVDGLCGVCGIPMKGSKSTIKCPVSSSSSGDNSSSTPRAMSQVTVSGGLTFTVSEQEGIQMGRQNANRLKQLKKLSLVLDLDHTLVHATADVRAGKHLDEREDVRSLILSMTEEATSSNLWMQHFVKLRPNVKEFLEAVMPTYEISVYTAGTRQYAEQIATVLCRHLVGAKRDQIQLDQLRYQVPRAEAELKSQPVESESIMEDYGNDDNKDSEEEPPPKKRKVGFAADTKPGQQNEARQIQQGASRVTAEDVARLKAELEDAEKLEREATEMRQRVFASRIVSRSDVGDLGRDVKSLRRIFPCGGTMAAVVDDREDVWANAKDNNTNPKDMASSRPGEPPENMLLVKPYHWQPFVGFADINNASGVDLSEQFGDKSSKSESTAESDAQLLWTADILKRLHARYYSQENGETKTAPEILHDMREEVLHGFNVVLSGLVPLHKQSQDENLARPRPSVVRYVESLGASLLSAVQPDTAFVIAARDGTDKILQARQIPGCSVVKVSWLMECFWTMTQRDPNQHLLTAPGLVETDNIMPNGTSAKSSIFDEDDDSEEEDDDFAAEFENDFM